MSLHINWVKRLQDCKQAGRNFFWQGLLVTDPYSEKDQPGMASAHAENIYGRSEEAQYFLMGFAEARDT